MDGKGNVKNGAADMRFFFNPMTMQARFFFPMVNPGADETQPHKIFNIM